MNSSTDLLHDYRALSQAHADRFDPAIDLLRVQIEQQVQTLRVQESDLVQQQQRTLDALREAIAADARWLLGLPEFRQYVEEAQPQSGGWSPREIVPLDPNPLNWTIYSADDAVEIFEYEEDEDLDDYDDERTHASYGYTVKVRMGTYCEMLYRTITKRVYGVRDTRYDDLGEQREQIESAIGDLFNDAEIERTEIDRLSQELSYLVGYACQLFTIKPRRIELSYPTPLEETE